MIKYKLFGIFFLLFLWLPVKAQVKISKSTFGNGASSHATSKFQLKGTFGQSAIGNSTNYSKVIISGFWYHLPKVTASTENSDTFLPLRFELKQNYPNPFNPLTTIEFTLPKQTKTILMLYDLLGREVATLVDDELDSGLHRVIFEANNLPSGIYIYRLKTKEFENTKKLILLK